MAGAIAGEAKVPDETLARFAGNPMLPCIFGDLEVGYLWIFPNLTICRWGLAPCVPGRASCNRF